VVIPDFLGLVFNSVDVDVEVIREAVVGRKNPDGQAASYGPWVSGREKYPIIISLNLKPAKPGSYESSNRARDRLRKLY
jgi:hypothetical protein